MRCKGRNANEDWWKCYAIIQPAFDIDCLADFFRYYFAGYNRQTQRCIGISSPEPLPFTGPPAASMGTSV